MSQQQIPYTILLSLFAAFLLSLTVTLFLIRQKERNRSRSVGGNVALAATSLFATLLLLEIFFRFFHAQSDGFLVTLANRNWSERYWQVNSQGYRDHEWSVDMLAGRTKVVIAGDSFVAGNGIANPADRFGDLLATTLGNTVRVLNLGMPGFATRDEIKTIAGLPFTPDVIILAFYVNDIEPTAREMGSRRPLYADPLHNRLRRLIEESYLLNFVYWRLVRWSPEDWLNDYWRWLRSTYADEKIWKRYKDELMEMHCLAKSRDALLLVVVFPNLMALEESMPITSKVESVFRDAGTPVLDVGKLVGALDPASLTVNAVDPHPSELVHRLVADRLAEMLARAPEQR